MEDKSDKNDALEKILKSQEFKYSRKHKDLLKHLAHSSIHGETLNEYSIAIDVFNKNADFNPSNDTTVRVNVHHLRKKLEKYYQKEGRHDKYRLVIPKGHYEVIIKKNVKTPGNIRKHWRSILELGLLAVVIVQAIWLFPVLRKGKTSSNLFSLFKKDSASTFIWSGYIKTNKQNLIALGEVFWFSEYLKDSNQWVKCMQSKIYTTADLEAYQQQYPNKIIKRDISVPYFAMNSVWPLPYVLAPLIKNNANFRLQRASLLSPRDLKETNIIFLGYYKSLGIFDEILSKMKFSFDEKQDAIRVISADDQKVRTLYREGTAKGFHEDYCIVDKIPGPRKNTIMILTSFRATGITGAAQYLSQQRTIEILKKRFIAKYKKIPPYFEILFKVTGYNRSNLSCEIADIRQFEPQSNLW